MEKGDICMNQVLIDVICGSLHKIHCRPNSSAHNFRTWPPLLIKY